MDNTNQIVCGIDTGGTNTRIAIIHAQTGAILQFLDKFPTPPKYEDQLHAISAALQPWKWQIAGVGVSIGGQVNPTGDSLRAAPNLPDYENKPLQQDLANIVQTRIVLAHDPVCGGIAEMWNGALQGAERCAFLTISTGIGAAVFYHQANVQLNVSVQIGHQILYRHTRPCLCGQTGCIETYLGGKQAAMYAGKPLETIQDPGYWRQYAEILAIGIINTAQLTRVELIAVSGSIALHHPEILSIANTAIKQQISSGSHVALIPARHQENAPLIGAARLLSPESGIIIH